MYVEGSSNWSSDEDTANWEGVEVDGMGNITKLTIIDNQIINLDSRLSSLEYLQKLTYSEFYSNVTDIPDVFEGLDSLTLLNICHNDINELPSSILTLPSLETLIFDETNIVLIPEELCLRSNAGQLSLKYDEEEAVCE